MVSRTTTLPTAWHLPTSLLPNFSQSKILLFLFLVPLECGKWQYLHRFAAFFDPYPSLKHGAIVCRKVYEALENCMLYFAQPIELAADLSLEFVLSKKNSVKKLNSKGHEIRNIFGLNWTFGRVVIVTLFNLLTRVRFWWGCIHCSFLCILVLANRELARVLSYSWFDKHLFS